MRVPNRCSARNRPRSACKPRHRMTPLKGHRHACSGEPLFAPSHVCITEVLIQSLKQRVGIGVASNHPLFALFDHAARGVFPPVDGAVTMTSPLVGGHEAIVCFTGHAVIATRLTIDELGDPAPDGYGSALHPRVQLLMANNGVIGVNDVTLVAHGIGGQPDLTRTEQWNDHPRVAHARALRSGVTVYGDESGFITIGKGLAGRNEMSIEVRHDLHDRGAGRRLIHGARQMTPPGSHVFAAVSPGNARSLRAFLSQGFTPIASEVIITPA